MTKQDLLEFIAVGHVTLDRAGSETRLGGAAAYAALTAHHLGVRTGLVTSAAADFPYWQHFDGIHIEVIEAAHTTELEHRFVNRERHQYVHHLAREIRATDIAALVSNATVADNAAVLYCPVVHELATSLTPLAPRGITAVAPQGFFREWDADGHIVSRDWDGAERALERVDVVCLSEKDAEAPEELAEDFAGTAFVITKGDAGCRVYAGGDIFDFPAPRAREVDATGAGDVFAASLVIALSRGEIVPDAVRFAMREAAAAVEYEGVEGLT